MCWTGEAVLAIWEDLARPAETPFSSAAGKVREKPEEEGDCWKVGRS